MKTVFLISCLMALTSASISVSAEKYYKWVDRQGVTHYSESKPEDIQANAIKIKVGKPATAPKQIDISTIEENTEAAALEASAPNDTREPAKLQTEQQLSVLRSNCAKAIRKLIALENAGRVRQLNEQGEYRYLPNQEKLAEISKMRSYLRSKCRGD